MFFCMWKLNGMYDFCALRVPHFFLFGEQKNGENYQLGEYILLASFNVQNMIRKLTKRFWIEDPLFITNL